MELRDYQVENSNKAVELLKKYKIAYFSMQVRTGKTITAFESIIKYGSKKVLFVTKKKAIESIKKDAALFPELDVTVINYESVIKVVDDYDLIVLDEAHGLGSFPKPCKRVKDLMPICKGKPIIYLSGTPTPESFSQIYHQFFVSSFSPFLFHSNFYKWAKEFVKVKKKYLYNREINDYSDAKIDLINKFTSHLFISTTQHEAGFDVTLDEKVLTVETPEIVKRMIDTLLRDNIITGKSDTVVADTAVKLQNKIHQLSSGTIITESGASVIISDFKARFIDDYFKEKKIAVYYKFKAELDTLKSVFIDWTDSPEEFQKNTSKTFLGQFVSSREGIRLDTADAIVFYNIDFSYLSYAQSKDRIISKERVNQAILYWIFSTDGIERKIYKAVCEKKNYTTYYFKRDYGVKSTK